MDFSFSFKKKPAGGPQPTPPKVNPAQEQFDALRGCGLNLRGHATLDQLTAGTDPASFGQAPFLQLLCLMGSPQESGEPWSDDVWLWPAACVTESGVATALIDQLARLCRGALPLEEVQDALDPEQGLLGLAFSLDGEGVEWSLGVADGEPDAALLESLAQIAADRGDGAVLASCEVEGVGRLLVFMQPGEIDELAQTTELPWAVVGAGQA